MRCSFHDAPLLLLYKYIIPRLPAYPSHHYLLLRIHIFHHYITPSPLVLSWFIPISRPPRRRWWWRTSTLSKHQTSSQIPIMWRRALWMSRPVCLPVGWCLWLWLMANRNGEVVFWWRLRGVLRWGVALRWAWARAGCGTGRVGSLAWVCAALGGVRTRWVGVLAWC